METQAGFADINGTRLYYEVAGTGKALVLIHANGMDTRMWDDQLEAFASSFHLVRYDVRGFGRSAPPIEGKSYSHVEDLSSLLEYLSISRAHVLGLSMGGGVALNFALERPDMLGALVLCDMAPPGIRSDEMMSKFWADVQAKVRSEGVAEAKRLFLSFLEGQPTMQSPELSRRLWEMVSDYSGWHWTHQDSAQRLQPSDIERLKVITAPTLSIVGEYDIPRYHEASELFSQRIPNSRKAVISGAGHFCNMEAPEEFNQVVSSFLVDV